MELLHSIAPIEKLIPTNGSRPFMILVEDFEFYICKYPKHPNDLRLVKEFIAQRFALQWGIQVPEVAQIDVAREHVPETMLGNGLSYSSVENPVLGFKQMSEVVEIMDQFSEGISNNELNKYDKADFLKIALFDLWLSHDDRNTNNTNLLINQSQNLIKPIAIDHETIFNTTSLDKGIYAQSYEESLFYTKLYHRLVTNSEKTIHLIETVCASLQSNIENCRNELTDIFNEIPEEWISNAEVLKTRLENNIFTESWLSTVQSTYKEYASLALGI